MKQSKGITGLAKGVASCPAQAAAYGQCITKSYKDVQQGMCQKEFEVFKSCVQQAVSFWVYIVYSSVLLTTFL
jgi:hypothetical protein